jgi:hypothetical protein
VSNLSATFSVPRPSFSKVNEGEPLGNNVREQFPRRIIIGDQDFRKLRGIETMGYFFSGNFPEVRSREQIRFAVTEKAWM